MVSPPTVLQNCFLIAVRAGRFVLTAGVSTLSLARGGCAAAGRASDSLTSTCLLLAVRTGFHFPAVE